MGDLPLAMLASLTALALAATAGDSTEFAVGGSSLLTGHFLDS